MTNGKIISILNQVLVVELVEPSLKDLKDQLNRIENQLNSERESKERLDRKSMQLAYIGIGATVMAIGLGIIILQNDPFYQFLLGTVYSVIGLLMVIKSSKLAKDFLERRKPR
jgi:hypothetical protein